MIRSIVAIVFIGIVCTNDIEQDVDYFDEEILNGITRQESSSAKDETMHRAEAEDQRVERYLNNLNEDNDEKSVTPKDHDLKAENLSDEDKMTEDVQLLMENVGKETENEFEREKKSAFWGRRRRTGRRRSSRRKGTGCHYVWHKFKCSDGCCWRITRKFGQCLNCDMKFYIGCGKYLFPPQRGPTMSTARSPTTDQSNWMKKVQSKQLHQVILPGSHHTGINKRPGTHLFDKWDIPQRMSVSNQLKAGVRFMDIRLATGPFLRQPSITHNYKYQNFEFLVRDTVKFLRVHKNEAVVMRLKGGKKDTIYYGVKFDWRVDWRKVDRVLRRYSSYIYTASQNPLTKKISDLRGKILICQESSTSKSTYYRVLCEGSWGTTNTNNPVQLKRKMTTWLNSLPSHSTSKFYFLEAICTPTVSDIGNPIHPFNCKRTGNRALYEPKSIEDMVKECNYQVHEWLRSKSLSKVNAMMIDFVNPSILNLIIAKN